MSFNDNGFFIEQISYDQLHSSMSEGAIIGISFAWIVGAIGFYILGMCAIRIWFRRKMAGVSQQSNPNNNKNHSRKKGGIQNIVAVSSQEQEKGESKKKMHIDRRYAENQTLQNLMQIEQKNKPSGNRKQYNIQLEQIQVGQIGRQSKPSRPQISNDSQS